MPLKLIALRAAAWSGSGDRLHGSVLDGGAKVERSGPRAVGGLAVHTLLSHRPCYSSFLQRQPVRMWFAQSL